MLGLSWLRVRCPEAAKSPALCQGPEPLPSTWGHTQNAAQTCFKMLATDITTGSVRDAWPIVTTGVHTKLIMLQLLIGWTPLPRSQVDVWHRLSSRSSLKYLVLGCW